MFVNLLQKVLWPADRRRRQADAPVYGCKRIFLAIHLHAYIIHNFMNAGEYIQMHLYTSQATRPRISGLVKKKQFFLKFLVYSRFLRSSPGIYGLVRVFTVKSGFRLWRIRMSTKFGNLRSIYGENCDKFLVGFRQFLVNFRLFSAYLWVDQFFGLFRLFLSEYVISGQFMGIIGPFMGIYGPFRVQHAPPFFHPARIAILENCRTREESG